MAEGVDGSGRSAPGIQPQEAACCVVLKDAREVDACLCHVHVRQADAQQLQQLERLDRLPPDVVAAVHGRNAQRHLVGRRA